MFLNQLPIYFSFVFLFAFLFPVVMVAQLTQKSGVKNGFKWVLGFYGIYLAVVAIASLNGFFDTVMLPPKIVLTTTLPLAVFLTILFSTKICKEANLKLRLEQLVGVHIFRLIGGFFIINGLEKILRNIIIPKKNFPIGIIRSSFS